MVCPDAQRPAGRRVRLIPIRGVMPVVDADEDAVLALIEDGKLLWAFNLAANPRRGAKELRIYPPCIADYMDGRECKISFEEVAGALTSARTDTIRAAEITTALNVSGAVTYGFIRAGELKACSTWKRGPRGSARVSVASFVSFMARRVWPVPITDNT